MKQPTSTILKMTALALASTFSYSLAVAKDDIGGGPLADFKANELTVPCVEVNNLSGSNANNKFYDVVLSRRGNSMNFELTYAAPEDLALCERLAAIAAFEDDDYSDDNPAPVENGFGILVRCELTDDRSSVSVDAKELAAGTYIATIKSGTNTEMSAPLTISGDHAEFAFDSDEDEIDDGAFEIDDEFITSGLKVTAEIVNDATDKVVYSATGQCLAN